MTVTKSWTELTIGVLLLISPWVLGFSDISVAKWCNVLFGLLLILISAWSLFGPPPLPKEEPVEKNNKHKK